MKQNQILEANDKVTMQDNSVDLSGKDRDEEVDIQLNKAFHTLNKVFNLPDGRPNVRGCEKYIETLKTVCDRFEAMTSAGEGKNLIESKTVDS